MTIETAAASVIGLACASVISLLWLGPIRAFFIDRARDSMFTARDGFFDAARKGLIRFDDPNYRIVRQAINNNIQYAHTVSSSRLAWHFLFMRHVAVPVSFGRHYVAARSIEDVEARKIAIEALDRADRAMAKLIVCKTPVVTTILLIIFVLVKLRKTLTLPEFDLLKVFSPYAYLVQVGVLSES